MVNHDPMMRTSAFLDDDGEMLMRSATNVLIEKHGVHVRGLVNNMSKSGENDKEKSDAYKKAYEACLKIVKNMEDVMKKNPYSPNNKARLLITSADGTVVLDTGKDKRKEDGTVENKNTLANATGKKINENHMSRFAIQQARNSEEGIGRERKLSTSTGQYETYRAQRLGPSRQDAMGIVRFSVKAEPDSDSDSSDDEGDKGDE